MKLHLAALGLLVASIGGALPLKPLTAETVPEAIQRGEQAKKAEDLCRYFDGIRTPISKGYARGYTLSVHTPFCGVALRAFEAKRKYEKLAPEAIGIPAADQQLIVLHVQPTTYLGGGFAIGGTKAHHFSGVEKVVLKRGNDIIQPTKSESEDVTFSNAYGKTETYKGGRFSFPASALGSGSEIVKVIIVTDSGQQGDEAVLELTPAELRRLE